MTLIAIEETVGGLTATSHDVWSKPTVHITEVPPVQTINLADQFLHEMRAVVALHGRYHSDTTRRYVMHGRGTCIVGKVLIRMGVPASTLAELEHVDADSLVNRLFPWSPDRAALGKVALVAQISNDDGMPWPMVYERTAAFRDSLAR